MISGKEARRWGSKYVLAAVFSLVLLAVGLFTAWQPMLYISNQDTGEIYVRCPVAPGSSLFFGWMHSLEKIPWNEYYHVDGNLTLVLDAISFPAFGAGIPAARGTSCYIKDGLIYMSGINEGFAEINWLNSHTATRDILVEARPFSKGAELPDHTRLRLAIQRRGALWSREIMKVIK